MSELDQIKQAMTDGEHTDGDLAWCVDRIEKLELQVKIAEFNISELRSVYKKIRALLRGDMVE